MTAVPPAMRSSGSTVEPPTPGARRRSPPPPGTAQSTSSPSALPQSRRWSRLSRCPAACAPSRDGPISPGRRDRVRLEEPSPDRSKLRVELVGELRPLLALLAVPGVRHVDVGDRLTHTTLARPRTECRSARSDLAMALPDSHEVLICAARRYVIVLMWARRPGPRRSLCRS